MKALKDFLLFLSLVVEKTYHRYSWSGYTSWLSVHLWGLAGVMFWLLTRAFI